MGCIQFIRKWCNKNAADLNIYVLGVSFMIFFTGFLPANHIEPLVLTDVKKEDKSFTGDVFTSMWITYSVLALANWFAPSLVALIGPKYCMILGFGLLCTFTASFLNLSTWSLYLTSFLVGLGSACIWTGHGTFLTVNSNESNISRNCGIFWSTFEMSFVCSHAMVYIQGLNNQLDFNITFSFSTFTKLLIVSAVGFILLFFLRVPEDEASKRRCSFNFAVDGFVEVFKLFFTRQMIILCVTFVFTGFEMALFTSMHGAPADGFTRQFNETSEKNILSLNGVFVGVGEIGGSFVFGVLAKWTLKYGRDVAFLIGYIIHLISYYVIFLNLTDDSPVHKINACSFVKANASLAVFASVLLGFGDGCFNTQIISLLGSAYRGNSAPAFAIYKSIQSLATTFTIFYLSQLKLRVQLFLMGVSGSFGLAAFCWIEWQIKAKKLIQARIDETALQSI